MAEFDRLIEQASKAASSMGGLLSILLAVKQHRTKAVVWYPNRAQFGVDGKYIGLLLIRKELLRIDLKIAAIIVSYIDNLYSGRWDGDKWRAEMDKLVENSHLIFAGLALGSLAAAAASVDVQRRITRDAAAVARFDAALRAGLLKSKPLAANRARSYVRSFYTTFGLLDHVAHIAAGYTEAKRVLTPAEHCRNSLAPGGVQEGCFEAALRGWMNIVEMPPIGTLVCGQFCKCYIIYR